MSPLRLALRPTVSATVSNGIWKMSCRTKATRSAGLSCCSTTSSASLTPSSNVTRSAGSARACPGRRRDELDLGGVVGALPAGAGGLDLVQAQAASHDDQPAALVFDLTEVRGHQARERVLHDVLGRADVPEHPECEINEVGTVVLVGLADRLAVLLTVHAASFQRSARRVPVVGRSAHACPAQSRARGSYYL